MFFKKKSKTFNFLIFLRRALLSTAYRNAQNWKLPDENLATVYCYIRRALYNTQADIPPTTFYGECPKYQILVQYRLDVFWSADSERFLIPGEIPFLLEVQEMVAKKRRQALSKLTRLPCRESRHSTLTNIKS